jgi:hypothetical protein
VWHVKGYFFVKVLIYLFSVILACGTAVAAPKFRDFVGTVYVPAPLVEKTLHVGWVRIPLYWSNIEPVQGVWKWNETDQLLRGVEARGLRILPMLAYTSGWAASVPGNSASPPKQIAYWANFVEEVVARYSKPPFSLRYFQIWNEPTSAAGFWAGTDEQFIDTVYIPAAKIVRTYHCYVVFGGWPASNSLQEFDRVLKYHDAWQWTDFLDIHYEGLPAWQYLYENWVKTGKCKGVWETEVGFTKDPDFISASYLSLLHWSLEVGWQREDEFKLFWYAAWGAGSDAPKCLSKNSGHGEVVLTAQGRRLALLSKFLSGGPLSYFSDYAVNYGSLSGRSMGFKVGDGILIAVLSQRLSLRQRSQITVQLFATPRGRASMVVSQDGLLLDFKAKFAHERTSVRFAPVVPSDPHARLVVTYIWIGGSTYPNREWGGVTSAKPSKGSLRD